MTQLHTTALRRQATDLLDRHGAAPKKLMLQHTAVSLGASLLVTFIGFLLSREIANTGGLSGVGIRSILSTVQSVLELAVMVLLPFWEIGILRAALNWRNSQNTDFFNLTEGFRRFGSVFSAKFWSGALYVAVGFAVFYSSTFLFLMTPWANAIEDVYTQLPQVSTMEELLEMMTPELTAQLANKMIPLFVIFGLLFAAASIFLFYRMRFADFFVMEDGGGIKAIVNSFRLTRGNCLQLFKLDLHFWWFYLLQGLSVAICYGDFLLSALGITLPFGEDGNFFLFYVTGILMQGILFWQCNAQRLTAYCLAFDAFQPPKPAQLLQEM